MRVAIVSDIHGNRQALEAVLDGDRRVRLRGAVVPRRLVGYGADPDVCVALVRPQSGGLPIGQPRSGVTGELDAGRLLAAAREAAAWTRETLAGAGMTYLRALAPLGEQASVGLYHASPRDPVWEYVLSPLQRICASTPSGTARLARRPLARGAVVPRFAGGAGHGETRGDERSAGHRRTASGC